jgi:6-pyruvoyl-tetrahydropterin synthase related domain
VLLWSPLLAIGAAAFAVEIPFFFFGTPSGHDVEFHLYSWLEVLAQWKQGIIYPRWAAMAHFGYGEPRFVFYPPASWTLGAGLSAIFPWTLASSIYIWLALVAAGVSMFVLARRWVDRESVDQRCLDRRDAIFAAVLYAVNPYHVVIVYWRSAFAELLASCLVPLLLLFVLKAVDQETDFSKYFSGRAILPAMVPLALLLAAAWLTNAPAAVMIHYSLVLLVAFFAWRRRSPRLLLVGTGAVALGACLAAVYLLPAIYEQRWVDIAQAVSAGSRPVDSFLFIHTTDADHDAFNHLISWVAVLEMAAIFAAVWVTRQWRETQRELWNVLLGWAIVCSVLMFPVSALLWKFLPKMEFMQFPWRWLLCLSLICSLFVTAGFAKSSFVKSSPRRWWWRGAVCVLSILVIVAVWHRIQAPWWDNVADLREMQDNMATGAGYEGVEEYTPLGADPAETGIDDKDARKVTVDGPAHAAIHVYRWDAESKMFTADMSAPDQLALRLVRYPAWRVEVNGRVVETSARAETGQMLVPVAAGMNRVEIRFARTGDRALGGWISIVAMAGVGVWSWRVRKGATLRG